MTNEPAKVADLTSGVGAAVLGFGLGAWLAPAVSQQSAAIALVGLLLHGFGMWNKHRLEGSAPQPWWVPAAYWVCWGLLAIIAIVLVASR